MYNEVKASLRCDVFETITSYYSLIGVLLQSLSLPQLSHMFNKHLFHSLFVLLLLLFVVFDKCDNMVCYVLSH